MGGKEEGDTLIIHPHRPMHKIQIHIIQPQRLEACIKSLLDSIGVHIPQFRSHEEILSLHEAIVNGGLDTLADVDFVAVCERGVDVTVSDFDGVVDCALGFFGAGLPRSFSRLLVCASFVREERLSTETQGGNLSACVEFVAFFSEGSHDSFRLYTNI